MMVRSLSIFAAYIAMTGFGAARAGLIGFEDLSLAPQSYQNGSTLNPPGSFTSGGAVFNNDYNDTYGIWQGWSYSNVTNVTTAGFMNQYAAYNVPGGGSGDGSAIYAIGFAYSQGDATITLPVGEAPISVRITNATYAALSVRDGDSFAKKFGGATGNDPDFLRLTIIGKDAQNQTTGTIDFYLADYRFEDNNRDYIVSEWTTVDLASLGNTTRSLSFGVTTSDVGLFGPNTPTYFAMDNLTTAAVPEPGSFCLLGCGGVAIWWRRRRNR